MWIVVGVELLTTIASKLQHELHMVRVPVEALPEPMMLRLQERSTLQETVTHVLDGTFRTTRKGRFRHGRGSKASDPEMIHEMLAIDRSIDR